MAKYFWLKLLTDFFDTEEIRAIEAQVNGPAYVCFWLKLLMVAIKQDQPGRLRLKDLPYTDTLLASVTHSDVDVVRSAMKLFADLGMVQIDQDHTLWIEEAQRLIGKESDSAARMRAFRERKARRMPSLSDRSTSLLPNKVVHSDRELNLEKEGGIPEQRTSEPDNFDDDFEEAASADD